MKIGVHLALWARQWNDDVIPYAETAADLGLDGVELSLLGMNPDRIRAIRLAVERRGLEITCTTGLGAQADISSLDPACRAAGLDCLTQSVHTAAALGSRLLTGVLYAPWNVRVQADRERRWAHAVGGLRQVARVAEREGVTLGLEAINRFETDLAIWRQIEPDTTEAARQGLAFLRSRTS